MEILAVIISMLVLLVAYQQWRTNSLRLRHELYERRLSVYKILLNTLNNAANVDKHSVEQLHDIYVESQFLFNSEIPDFIDAVWKKTNELAKINEIFNSGNSDLTLKKKWSVKLEEIETCKSSMKSKFSPYLKLT